MCPRIAAVLLALLAIASPLAAATRITHDINGVPTPIEWAPTAFPLGYEIDQRLSGLRPKIDRAFTAWSSIAEANVRFEPRGFVQTALQRNDGRIVVSMADDLFRDQGSLAMTMYTYNENGRFVDADIQIDPSLLAGGFNVDSALRHEVGHLLGLDHSAVLSSVMYPYVNTAETPDAFDTDDRITIVTTYPKGDPLLFGATLQGRVMGDHGGIYGAQVVALNDSGSPVATSLTQSSGEFILLGVPRGKYRIYAEPLDGPVEVSALQGSWKQAKSPSFPTQFYEGPPIDVENGKVYGNLLVTTAGAVQLNPRWIGRVDEAGDVSLTTNPVCVKTGETMTLAVAGDGFTSGMTQVEVLNPGVRRVSDFSWSANYVKATFLIEPSATLGSAVIVVRNGRDSAALTGAMRIHRADKTRSVRR